MGRSSLEEFKMVRENVIYCFKVLRNILYRDIFDFFITGVCYYRGTRTCGKIK